MAELQNRRRRDKKIVKLLKLLLSLHSLRLIVISVIAITYLAMAIANTSNKTGAVEKGSAPIVSEEYQDSEVESAEPLDAKMEIDAIAYQERGEMKGDKK